MTEQEIKDKIDDAHKTADRLLTHEELRTKWNKLNGYMNEVVGVATRWHVLGIVLVMLILWSPFSDASCTYKHDSWGNTKYDCDSGQSGTLRTDAWGNTRDTGTGTTYRTDMWGNTRGSDGTRMRTDSWGNTRITSPNGEVTTWRRDAWGNLKSDDGTTCRTDMWGTTRCD